MFNNKIIKLLNQVIKTHIADQRQTETKTQSTIEELTKRLDKLEQKIKNQEYDKLIANKERYTNPKPVSFGG